jgi:hypothetical protein
MHVGVDQAGDDPPSVHPDFPGAPRHRDDVRWSDLLDVTLRNDDHGIQDERCAGAVEERCADVCHLAGAGITRDDR